jgi:hypothetical protein
MACFVSETLVLHLTPMKQITLKAVCHLVTERTLPGAEPECPLES